MINEALAQYDATTNADGCIVRRGVTFGIRVKQKGKRLRFESADGRCQASGPIAASSVERFVESFWFWKKETQA